jgi:hypothetical protein
MKVYLYWEGADKNNIDSIINHEFREWKSKYESPILKTAL